MAPALTVVMPYYRAEATVGRAVESIRAQTFTDWKLIIVADGCSTPIFPNDPRIEVLHLAENGGFANALAEGLAVSESEWWTPHDADDWSDSDRFEVLFDRVGMRDAVLAPIVEHTLDGEVRVVPVKMWRADRPLGHVAWHQPGLYRTEVARRVGWKRDVRYCADSLFTNLIARNHNPVVISDAHYHLVRTPGSLTSNRASPEYRRDRQACVDEWHERTR